MLEESLPSIWASMIGWFTPTVLFVLLNLMIGTIAVTSGIGTQKNQQQTTEGKQPQLVRSPSVLQRLKSINLYRYRSEEVNPFPSITTTTFLPPELGSQQTLDPTPTPTHEEKENLERNPDEILDHHVVRTKSDTKPSSGDMPVKLPQKMKKSASSKSAFGHFKEQEIIEPRPSTVREGKKKASDLQSFGDDEEVDAKADDFINKFKQELKLQRIDSLIRYKELLSSGGK